MIRRDLPFAPLQPSKLQVVSGPPSPASPRSPFGLRPRPGSSSDQGLRSSYCSSTTFSETAKSDTAPVKPDAWTWRCHQCRSRFPLGATRRCLHDGHYLCSGVREVSRRSGRMKHLKSCSSEFDYAGWRAYSKWKRRANRYKNGTHPRNDGNCIFPSECRWSPESRAKRLREELGEVDEDNMSQPADAPTPTFDSILGLPLYGESLDFPEPTVSFAARGDHPNPLSSLPAGSGVPEPDAAHKGTFSELSPLF